MPESSAAHLARLQVYFETSPAISLLRSPNAPYVIDFLDQQFKRGSRVTVGQAELAAALADYQARLHESEPDRLRDKAEAYLAQWCANDTRWLHRFLEANHTEPSYELTPHTEQVLSFWERALDQDLGFVGTESRLKLIIDTLADLVVQASDDPAKRLAHLQAEGERIDHQIARIEREGHVASYQPAQIRERFAIAVMLLKQLQGDFRAVEEQFKRITQQVQQRQAKGDDHRGQILAFALDSEDVLKQQDQGVSFYEFFRLIISPTHQERLEAIIEELGLINALAQQAEGLEAVRRMIPSLLMEAEKVMRTSQRLSATLRRLLDARASQERQRVAQLLREIRGLAALLANHPPRETVALDLETKIELSSPLARSFWTVPKQIATVDLAEHLADDDRRSDAFRLLANLQRIEWRRLRACVHGAASRPGGATLGELLADEPPQAGVVEVLAYLQIAVEDKHYVSRDATERVVILPDRIGDLPLALELPLVRFLKT
jgi:hypothetical protein